VYEMWRQFAEMEVDRRASIARELLNTEQKYLRLLDVVGDVFHSPCEAALMSNRAILSTQNVKLLFTDVLQLRDLSRCASPPDFSHYVDDAKCIVVTSVCVCLCVRGCMPTLLHVPGCDLGEW